MPEQDTKTYVAVVERSAVRNTQICRSECTDWQKADYESADWNDLDDAEVYLGLYHGTKKQVLAAAAAANYISENSVHLIEVTTENLESISTATEEPKMLTLKTEIHLPQSKIQEVNQLLSLSLEEMTTEELAVHDAKRDDERFIFDAILPDGSMLRADLISGGSNYWISVAWVKEDLNAIEDLEPKFDLNSFEFKIGTTYYIVNIIAD